MPSQEAAAKAGDSKEARNEHAGRIHVPVVLLAETFEVLRLFQIRAEGEQPRGGQCKADTEERQASERGSPAQEDERGVQGWRICL